MRNKMSFLITIALIFNVSLAANASIKMWYARIETNLGSIDLELDTPHAPITVGNFVSNTQNGAYLNGLFYRAVTLDNQPTNQFKIEVVQGGSNETFPRPPQNFLFALAINQSWILAAAAILTVKALRLSVRSQVEWI